MEQDWPSYYEALKDRPPRHTAVFARRRHEAEFGRPGFAIDLGAGGGRDVLPLLAAGWRVLAIDREPSAADTVLAATPPAWRERLETRTADFCLTPLPNVDLIVSSFALPLAPKSDFPALWERIRDALAPHGRFAGQLYGIRDSWARGGAADGVVAFERASLLELLAGMTIESFEEEEHDGVTPRGAAKHWHIFHIVARS